MIMQVLCFFQKTSQGLTNNAGTATVNGITNQNATNGLTAGQNVMVSGTNILFTFGGNPNDTFQTYWYLKIWSN